ncbi:MAG: OsmC family protein [Sediminibacterium sp.]|nr:MAG: putative redox [Chitinophagaceae bacterium]MDP1843792.1 OsmC family protein [Sediminibacterium sp.]TXT33167.1 MAG: putative redox protein [Chitinophagaceae bacterium]
MDKIEVKRVDDAYAFVATDSNGNTARMDASVAIGGHNSGIRPMQTILMGLGGCGGVDIISILKKQKQEITEFKMVIEGEREHGKEPALWKEVNIQFYFTGQVDLEKAEKAVALSLNKYCSVAATLRAAGCQISWTVSTN